MKGQFKKSLTLRISYLPWRDTRFQFEDFDEYLIKTESFMLPRTLKHRPQSHQDSLYIPRRLVYDVCEWTRSEIQIDIFGKITKYDCRGHHLRGLEARVSKSQTCRRICSKIQIFTIAVSNFSSFVFFGERLSKTQISRSRSQIYRHSSSYVKNAWRRLRFDDRGLKLDVVLLLL